MLFKRCQKFSRKWGAVSHRSHEHKRTEWLMSRQSTNVTLDRWLASLATLWRTCDEPHNPNPNHIKLSVKNETNLRNLLATVLSYLLFLRIGLDLNRAYTETARNIHTVLHDLWKQFQEERENFKTTFSPITLKIVFKIKYGNNLSNLVIRAKHNTHSIEGSTVLNTTTDILAELAAKNKEMWQSSL